MHWTHASLSDRGALRPRNEDAVLVLPEQRLYAVADGMGGHPAGDVASRLAVETLATAFRPPAPDPESPAAELELTAARLGAAFDQAHRAVLAGWSDPERRGMGTTLTALVLLTGSPAAVIAHVGDSRASRFRDGTLTALTRDHTRVQELLDAGMLTPAAARSHPGRSVLTRVLGIEPWTDADIAHADVLPGDLFLLCSDGLHGVIPAADLTALLAPPLPLETLAAQLHQAAMARGGPDNISLILLRAQPDS